MAFTPEELAALGDILDQRINAKLDTVRDAQAKADEAGAAQAQVAKAGVPDVDPAAGPWFYVHLSNGQVIETQDSGATHMDLDGETVAVIGRYQMAEKPEDDTLSGDDSK